VRLLHTADWHVGRTLMNESRQPDIEAAVSEVVAIAREQRPDLILHAGDLFDAVRPATHDMHWAIDRLRELADVAPVFVLCGNHDSPALFALFDKLLGPKARVRFIPYPLPPDRGGVIDVPGRGSEIIRLAPVPFIHSSRIVRFFEDPATWMTDYADRVAMVLRTLDEGLQRGYDGTRHVLLLAAHLFVTGSRFSQSERPLTVTDAYATRSEYLPAVTYSAYGHIHRPQALPGTGAGRYAGSLVPLDFGERDETKEVVLVEARPGRPPRVESVPLAGGRPLRHLEGTLEELARIAPGVGSALCLVTVRTEEPTPDLSERVGALLPHAVLLDIFEDSASKRLTALSELDVAGEREASFTELFRDYLSATGVRAGSADGVLRTFETLIAAVENEEEAAIPDVQELESSLAPAPR
jgi:exonuclease SbcD